MNTSNPKLKQPIKSQTKSYLIDGGVYCDRSLKEHKIRSYLIFPQLTFFLYSLLLLYSVPCKIFNRPNAPLNRLVNVQ